MHVLNPKEIAKRQHAKKRATRRGKRKAVFTSVVLVVVVGILSWMTISRLSPSISKTENVAEKPKNEAVSQLAVEPKTQDKLKTFTGVQFRDLYRSINYPNTQSFATPPEITGDLAADARIRTLAEQRGFVLTSVPVAPIEKSGEELTGEYQDDLLQPLASKAWKEIKAAAKKDGIAMSLISGYRSPKSQRDIFTQRLYSTGITANQIAAGYGDNAVNTTLSLTAVPGYSRHHTGYTIDIQCDDGLAFGSSSCNQWISKNNYENAKKFGWIPSYPPDAGEQGPEPEPWEYVWVGPAALYE